MAAWVDVDTDPYAWTSRDAIWQLAAAINERRAAAGRPHPHVDEPFVGDVIQSSAFWDGLMDDVDALIPYFVNTYLYPSGFNGLGSIVMYTRSSFTTMLAAQSDVDFSYWRASTNDETYDADINDCFDEDDPMYSSTVFFPLAGHRIGPWHVKMLQDHLKYLISTKEAITGGVPSGYGADRRIGNTFGEVDCATNLTALNTAWNSASWEIDQSIAPFYRSASIVSNNEGNWGGSTTRYRSVPYIDFSDYNIFTPDHCSCDIYYLMEGEVTYDDVDGFGVAENEWYFHETLASGAATTRTGNVIGNYSFSPISLQSVFCPTTGRYGIESRYSTWVLHWTFDQEYDWETSSSSESESSESESSESESSSSSSSESSESASSQSI